jgi:hypothetical protein
VRIFKVRDFAKFARKNEIDDEALCDAIQRACKGLIDSDLGGGVIKQRVARPGEGKRGGYRTIIAFQTNTHSVFLHGFAKKMKDNITKKELKVLKELAEEFLSYDEEQLERLVETGSWVEVVCDGQEDVSE